MTNIKQNDLIQSVADAFQFISYYHPKDFIEAMGKAYSLEKGEAAKDAIAQILTNSRMCAEGHRPLCQDTGIAVVFLKIGMNVQWPDATMSVTEMVNEGVRRAYLNPDNTLRASVLTDPAGKRKNTGDNTPAVVHYEIVPGDDVEVICAAKGGGSENKAKLAMLNPSDDIVGWILSVVQEMGAGWCPPGVLGVGIRRVTGGQFSNWANDQLRAGSDIDLLTPDGRFGIGFSSPERRHYLGIAGGSGITPMLSLIKAALETEPQSHFTLVYGNRTVASIMFLEELEGLKNRWMERLSIFHVLSEETTEIELLSGLLDQARIARLCEQAIRVPAIDCAFVCGPAPMMAAAEAARRGPVAYLDAGHVEAIEKPEHVSEVRSHPCVGIEVERAGKGRAPHILMLAPALAGENGADEMEERRHF